MMKYKSILTLSLFSKKNINDQNDLFVYNINVCFKTVRLMFIFLFIQKETQEMTTSRMQGPYTFTYVSNFNPQ